MPQIDPNAQSGIMGFISNYGLLIVMFVAIFLLMIIPQRKRKKQMQQMMESMVPGKQVKTIGGMYGKIVAVKEDLVTIEAMPDKVRLVFTKGAIATVEDAEVEENTLEKK
jgi:preprotein translocase subunit YajC